MRNTILALLIFLTPNLFGNVIFAKDFTQDGVSTVIVEGVGSDLEGAAKNAAENALRLVLGSFVQSDLMVARQTEIANGIRSQASSIRSSIREYSQGSIAGFEITGTGSRNGLFLVTARVVVRTQQFSGFVRQIAEGKGEIGPGLFAEVQTGRKQQADLKDIIVESIVNPIVNGEVVDIRVGKPVPFSDSIFENYRERLGLDDFDQFERSQTESLVGRLLREISYESFGGGVL